MTTYTHILDLAKEAEPPANGILSRTVFQDDRLKTVVFGFGTGLNLPFYPEGVRNLTTLDPNAGILRRLRKVVVYFSATRQPRARPAGRSRRRPRRRTPLSPD